MTKSGKNVNVSDVLSALLKRMDKQDAAIASLVDVAAKPAVKPAVQAAKAAPELSVEIYRSKNDREDGVMIKYGSAKWGTVLRADQWALIKKNAALIDQAFKKI